MWKKRDKKPEEIDDGRVIASMNVDGMPWYTSKKAPDAVDAAVGEDGIAVVPEKMTRKESMAFMFGVIRASLLVSVAFIGGLYLFILFCIYIWLA